jgi:hypothetical protein
MPLASKIIGPIRRTAALALALGVGTHLRSWSTDPQIFRRHLAAVFLLFIAHLSTLVKGA